MAAKQPFDAHRPTIAVTTHAIAAGHYLAATAGFEILQAGGNAIDAGVAAGIALGILQIDLVDFAGVAPIMIYHAEKREIVTIAGLGTWPRALATVSGLRGAGSLRRPFHCSVGARAQVSTCRLSSARSCDHDRLWKPVSRS